MRKISEDLIFYCGFFLVRLLCLSCRLEIHDAEKKATAKACHPRGAVALAAWHEHVIMLLFSQAGDILSPIVSRSAAGRFVGYVCKRFGHDPIYGSEVRNGKDKGGATALMALMRRLKAGGGVAFTVDGSIGPRRVVKQGIVDLSRKTQARILPIGFAATRYWELNTWDRLKIPKPFSRIVVVYGDAVAVPATAESSDLPEFQKATAAALNMAEQAAIERLPIS